MTSRDFVYWLQGFFEINDPQTINKEQTQIIKNHLNLVFHHDIDKQYQKGDGSQKVHDGKPLIDTGNFEYTEDYKPNFVPYWDKHDPASDGLIRC